MPDKIPLPADPGESAEASPSTPAPADTRVWLRGPTGEPVLLSDHAPLELVYRYWTYVVANRLRISEDNRAELQRRALRDLQTLGVSTLDLTRLAGSGIVEVSVPYWREAEGWAARVCPWESILSLATKPLRKPDQHLTVVRHLRCTGGIAARAPRPPERVLIVVSAPGKLRNFFDFEGECELVKSAFLRRVADEHIRRINNPTLDELTEAVGSFRPDVIHLAGIDSHQAAALLRTSDEGKFDGYMLRSPNNQPVATDGEIPAKGSGCGK